MQQGLLPFARHPGRLKGSSIIIIFQISFTSMSSDTVRAFQVSTGGFERVETWGDATQPPLSKATVG